jgi:hypothetical protein
MTLFPPSGYGIGSFPALPDSLFVSSPPRAGEVGGPLAADQYMTLTQLAVRMGLGIITSDGGALRPSLGELITTHPEFHRAAEAAIGSGIDATKVGDSVRLTLLGPERLHEGSDRLHGPPTPTTSTPERAPERLPLVSDRILRDLEAARGGEAMRQVREAASVAARIREHGIIDRLYRPPTQGDLDMVGPVAKRTMPDEDFSFLDDPNISLEEKLMLFMAKLADKRDAEIRELLGELSNQERGGGGGGAGVSEARGGDRGGGPLGAITAMTGFAGTIIGMAVAGPAGAAVGSMVGNMAGEMISSAAGGSGRGTVEVNAPGRGGPGGAEAAEGKKRGENEILQRIQYLQGRFDRINALITNYLQSSHSSRMAVLNNLRG